MVFPKKTNILLISADFGNSRLKIYTQDFYLAVKYSDNWCEETVSAILKLKEDNKTLEPFIAFSSVNKQKLKEFQDFTGNYPEIKFIDAFETVKENSQLEFKHIEGIGSDRVFGMLGALQDAEPPFFTVDCGTATTVNAVDNNNKCLGGAIFAGADSQNFALGRLTSALKPIVLEYSDKPAGENTKEAMNSGIIRSCAGGIFLICKDITENNFLKKGSDLISQKIPVFLTGGSALLVLPLLENLGLNVILSKHLVLKGIYSVFKNKNLKF